MDHHNKQQLFNRLVQLLENKGLTPKSYYEKTEMEKQIRDAINASLEPTTSYETREVNILLSDLRGFTALAEQFSARQIIELLNRYFHQMSEIILSYGGTIDKFMGDSIMVLFGAPTQEQDDLLRCLACAVEMQMAMAKINLQNHSKGLPDIFMGIGINSGSVVAGSLGSSLHSEYTVIGDEVNLASRIEAHSLRGQILLSENTYQKARDFISIGRTNEVMVKGKKDPVKLYELIATTLPKSLRVPQREGRHSHRVPVNMPIAYHCINGKKVETEAHYGTIVDISYGGLFAFTSEALPPMSEVKISMSLSLMSDAHSDIYARVLRSERRGDNNECHLEFTSIPDHARSVLKQFVDQQVATH